MDCRICGEPIPQKRADLKYDTCIECAERHTKRFLGRRGEKGIGIEIFRTDLTNIGGYLNKENHVFGPGLGIESVNMDD